MKYPKSIMKISELKRMGFPEQFLLNAYFSENQKFAWKMDVSKRNSPILFDTELFEIYRMKQLDIDRQTNKHSAVLM